jgi:HlyD family secretion protein
MSRRMPGAAPVERVVASGKRASVQLGARLPTLLVGLLAVAACSEPDEGRMVGTLERDRIELAVESNEPIVAIEVEDGQPVTAGTVILRQAPARLQGRLDQARAQRDQAAARLAELRRGPRPEDIERARAELAAVEAERRNAKANLDREQELFDRGLGQEQDLDLRRTRFEDAVARERASRQALERLLNGTTVEELDQAEAALEALEATVTLAALDLERATVTAPVDGLLDRVWFEVGERPAPGAAVAVILDASRPYARLYVPEHRRADIRPGTRLRVAVDGVPEPLEGTVRWVSADASFTPYFALTEHDRSRLAYLAEVELPGARELPSGVPLEAWLP